MGHSVTSVFAKGTRSRRARQGPRRGRRLLTRGTGRSSHPEPSRPPGAALGAHMADPGPRAAALVRTPTGEGTSKHHCVRSAQHRSRQGSSVFYFTFNGKVFVNFLPFQGLASLEKVKNIFYLFHQVTKKLKISEFRAKINGNLLKTSNIKQNFRLRRAKSVKTH